MKLVLGAVAAACFVAVAVLLLSWTTYFAELNSIAYDFTLRLSGPIAPSAPVLIVAIDEDSLDQVGAWPWARDRLAGLIARIQSGQPRAIGVDVLLDDRRSNNADNVLAAAISATPSIVLATRIDDVNGIERWRDPDDKFRQAHVRLGHVHADPDFDGISRRVFSVKIADGRAVPAFAIEALRAARLPVKGDSDQKTGGVEIIRPRTVNIRFAGDSGTFRHVPAWEVLADQADPDQFRDQIVLIGSTAEGLQDQWFTPFSESGRKMSGVEIHANAINTLYTGNAILETPDGIVWLGLFAVAMLLWWIDRRFEGRRFYAAAVLSLPAIVVLSWLLMKYFNTWFPFPPFLTAIVFVVPGLEVAKMVLVNRDLDHKIERLAVASLGERRGFDNRESELEARNRILSELPEGPDREAWLSAIEAHDRESALRDFKRERLFRIHRHNSRWKLDAVDYFNEELMQFLSFNKAVLASIEDIIVVSDPAGRVVYQNPAARRLEGYREDPAFAPDYFGSLLDGRKFMAQCAAVLANQEPLTVEFIPGRNGRRFYNVTLSPISRAGIVVSMHDVTAQQELNQAKNDMVSLVSHELRTPLTAIRGYSDMLLKYGLVQEKGKEFLGTIVEESQRLNQLIQSFLDIAYIESGRQKITKSDFEVGTVLKDMLSILEPAAEARQIAIEITANTGPMRIRADRLLLYQALTNLVTNAIKYSPAATTVQIAVTDGNGKIRFQVVDQGCGIPAEEASRIFEKFYRRANKETRDQSGFGLGLAFVKEVATRHGGDVIVESEVGKGSVFTLWIPNEES